MQAQAAEFSGYVSESSSFCLFILPPLQDRRQKLELSLTWFNPKLRSLDTRPRARRRPRPREPDRFAIRLTEQNSLQDISLCGPGIPMTEDEHDDEDEDDSKFRNLV